MFELVQQKTISGTEPRDPTNAFGPLAQIDFVKLAGTVRRQAKFIGAVTAACVFAMCVFILLATPQYTAVTEILINPSDLRAVGDGLTSPAQLTDANIVQVESQVRVLTSDSVLRRVVASEHLDIDTEFTAGASTVRKLLNGALMLIGLGPANETDRALEALIELRKRIRAHRAERTYVVDVSVATREAEKSVRIANAIARAYLIEQSAATSDAARRVSDSISGRLAELKARVRDAEERVEQFKARNDIVDSQGQLVNERQLTELNNHLMQARARTAEAQSRYDLVKSLHQGGIETGALPEAIQSQAVTALRAQYALALRQESEQRATLGDKHPTITEMRVQVETLRRLIREEIGRIGESLRNDFERAKNNEASLERDLDSLKRNAVSTKEQLVPLRELEREVQTSRAVYESFLTRARETGEQERLDTKNIRVISPADLPQRRSWPPRNLFLLLGAVLFGAAAGTGLALVRGAPGAAGAPGTAAGTETTASADDLRLLAVLPPRSTGRELEVLARPQLLFSREMHALEQALQTEKLNRIMIVAAKDDDDSAAVGLNLAAIAAVKRNVLLVDADPRRRAIARLVAFAPSASLADVAAGSVPLAVAVRRDERSRINIAALAPTGRTEAMDLAQLAAAVEAAKNFDLVVITASGHDDSVRLVADLADRVVVIVDAGGIENDDANVFALLDGHERKIAGIVVANDRRHAQPTAA